MHRLDGHNTTWGDKRRSFYDLIYFGTPCLVYDGLEDAWPIEEYAGKLADRQAVTTDVTLDLGAVPAVDPNSWEVSARVCVEAGGLGKNVTLHMVEVLDGFPVHRDFSRNGFRQAVDTADVALASGACETVVRTFTFDATSAARPEDVSIIAWAQTVADEGPAEVFQAAQMRWPFPVTGEIFLDGFETGDTAAWVPPAR